MLVFLSVAVGALGFYASIRHWPPVLIRPRGSQRRAARQVLVRLSGRNVYRCGLSHPCVRLERDAPPYDRQRLSCVPSVRSWLNEMKAS